MSYWHFVYDYKVLRRYRKEKTIAVIGIVNAIRGERLITTRYREPVVCRTIETNYKAVEYNKGAEVVYTSAVPSDGAVEIFTKNFFEDYKSQVNIDEALINYWVQQKKIHLLYLEEEGPASAMPKDIVFPRTNPTVTIGHRSCSRYGCIYCGVILIVVVILSVVGALVRDWVVGLICLLYIPTFLVALLQIYLSSVLVPRKTMALKGGVSCGVIGKTEDTMERGLACQNPEEIHTAAPAPPVEVSPLDPHKTINATAAKEELEARLPADELIVEEAKKLAKKVDMEQITYKRFSTRLMKRLHLVDADTKKLFRITKKAVIKPVMSAYGWHEQASKPRNKTKPKDNSAA